jgi:hypothetical protein
MVKRTGQENAAAIPERDSDRLVLGKYPRTAGDSESGVQRTERQMSKPLRGQLEVIDGSAPSDYRVPVLLTETPSCYQTEGGIKYRKKDGRLASTQSRPRYRLRLETVSEVAQQ